MSNVNQCQFINIITIHRKVLKQQKRKYYKYFKYGNMTNELPYTTSYPIIIHFRYLPVADYEILINIQWTQVPRPELWQSSPL